VRVGLFVFSMRVEAFIRLCVYVYSGCSLRCGSVIVTEGGCKAVIDNTVTAKGSCVEVSYDKTEVCVCVPTDRSFIKKALTICNNQGGRGSKLLSNMKMHMHRRNRKLVADGDCAHLIEGTKFKSKMVREEGQTVSLCRGLSSGVCKRIDFEAVDIQIDGKYSDAVCHAPKLSDMKVSEHLLYRTTGDEYKYISVKGIPKPNRKLQDSTAMTGSGSATSSSITYKWYQEGNAELNGHNVPVYVNAIKLTARFNTGVCVLDELGPVSWPNTLSTEWTISGLQIGGELMDFAKEWCTHIHVHDDNNNAVYLSTIALQDGATKRFEPVINRGELMQVPLSVFYALVRFRSPPDKKTPEKAVAKVQTYYGNLEFKHGSFKPEELDKKVEDFLKIKTMGELLQKCFPRDTKTNEVIDVTQDSPTYIAKFWAEHNNKCNEAVNMDCAGVQGDGECVSSAGDMVKLYKASEAFKASAFIKLLSAVYEYDIECFEAFLRQISSGSWECGMDWIHQGMWKKNLQLGENHDDTKRNHAYYETMD